MTIHQISVFLENKFGRLNEMLALIAKEDIRIIASVVSDTSEFGILRIIVNDHRRASQVLKDNHISANLTEVFVIKTEAKAGQLANVIECFTKAGISIEYMYCFSSGKEGILALKVNNKEAALEVIRRNNLICVSEQELLSM